MTEKAVDLFYKAGKTAIRLFAYESAIAALDPGLALLRTLPDTTERARRELEFLLALGPPLMVARGYASIEVEQLYIRLQELFR